MFTCVKYYYELLYVINIKHILYIIVHKLYAPYQNSTLFIIVDA